MAAPLPHAARLLLASDGAYELYEDADGLLAQHLAGAPAVAARALVGGSVSRARARHDPEAENAAALVADVQAQR
ncbi:hypothetical protein OG590_38965 (plasmid) [Streptomyces goshikiensis]|uniref:hypothetical protein n=1 Tax=Streptomyces goshikiensis TaxID=1942 RepID=UPI002F914C94|nr:hypothetical protein OG590_38965 [Streptomyces goshikiensis]